MRRDIIGVGDLPDGRQEYLMHNEALCRPYYLAASAPAEAQVGAQVPSWTTRALHAEASNNALENALRLVLMQSVDFDNSFCKLCQTKDRHADDCISKIASDALAFWAAGR